MQTPRIQLQLARERLERELEHAAHVRLLDRPKPSIRRAVGHSIMRIGARLAAEPSLELSQSN